ncbi:MAG: hypothetical protein RL711_1590 [Bacteroidota bacterium]
MASVKFEFRSTKQRAFLTLRFSYVINDEKFSFRTLVKLETTKDYWEKHHNQERPRDIDIKNKQTEVKTELNKIENYILDCFNSRDFSMINKEWLQTQIDNYYNPPKPIEIESKEHELISYIDKYIEAKRKEVAPSSTQKSYVNKQMLIRYQEHHNNITYYFVPLIWCSYLICLSRCSNSSDHT